MNRRWTHRAMGLGFLLGLHALLLYSAESEGWGDALLSPWAPGATPKLACIVLLLSLRVCLTVVVPGAIVYRAVLDATTRAQPSISPRETSS